MIHFYKEKVELAKRLIDAKSIYDDMKAAKDLDEISFTLSNAQPTSRFVWDARQLDKRINNDYPEIGEMHRVASEMSNYLKIQKQEILSEYDAILADLKSDMFGIFISVLIKHEEISCIKEFIESVD